MTQVKAGDKVNVHYTGKLDDGEVFDSSLHREPLQFTVGGGDMIAGFDNAVVGMTPGDSKTVTIPAQDAYGPYMEERIMTFEKDKLPEGWDPGMGECVKARRADGHTLTLRVVDIADESVTFDANHPLAGKDLTFEIELIDIL